MSTNIQIINHIQTIIKDVSECLQRSRQIPGPSAARFDQLSSIETKLLEVAQTQQQLQAAGVAQIAQRLNEKQAEVQAVALDVGKYSAEANHTAQLMQGTKHEQNGVEYKELLEKNRDAKSKLREAQGRQNESNRQVAELNAELNRAQSEWYTAEAAQELIALRENAKNLLSEAGNLETSLAKGDALDQRAAFAFEAKEAEFDEAAQSHRRQANLTLVALLFLVAGASYLIYLTFTPAEPPDFQSVVRLQSEQSAAAMMEHIILVGVGRLSTLLLFAWGLKYVGGLHRSHSEQAILYRDRKAALVVAANLLRASLGLEQKQQLLQNLARGYLDFEQNAFHVKNNPQPDSAVFKQLREAVEVVEPILRGVKDVVVKANK